MGTKRYELTESEWNRIKDILPPEHPKEGKRGRPAKCDNRTALNGMLWIARGGAPWRELPERYGPWQTVYARFRKWRDMGVFEAVFQTLSIDADFENISIDSTSCKVHQSANGGKKNWRKSCWHVARRQKHENSYFGGWFRQSTGFYALFWGRSRFQTCCTIAWKNQHQGQQHSRRQSLWSKND